jgi:ABC-type phosphate transport system substrate-binding protein
MKGITRMSDTTSAPKRGARAIRAGLLASALAALTAIGFAPVANADFTSAKCGGTNLDGNGASFAKGAQEVFNFNFKNFYCAGSSLNVAYNANGSGAGILTMQLRNNASRFAGTDDPPTPTQANLMNSGAEEKTVEGKTTVVADTNPANDGKVHVIPIAAGAIAPLVNFPEGCSPEALADKYRTVSAAQISGEAKLKGILRVRFTKELFEEVWAGVKNTKWSEAFPELVPQGAPCEKPIIRVVRFDNSGTTFGFKDYLHTINPGREWTTKFQTGTNGNREWPSAEFGFPATGEEKSQCGAKVSAPGGKQTNDAIDFLTSACANGAGELVKKLSETDGSIGYADIATARNASTGTLAVDASKSTAPTTPYWTQAQNGSVAVGSAQEKAGSGFTEPTFDEVNGFKTTAAGNPSQKGANCKSPGIFKNFPGSSLGDWSKTSGVNAATGFGICTLTYALVFDDNAAVFGNKPEEEGKARTLKDYEEYIVHDGQAQLFGADYAPLPADVLTISQAAVAAVGWNKAGSGGGGSGGGGGSTGGGSGGGGGGGTVVVSNQFSIPRKTISSKTGSATFSVKLPGAGKLGVLGTAKVGKKTIKVGNVTLTVSKAGTYSVTLKPTGAAKQLLSKKGSLKVNLTFTFSPTGGAAKSTTSAVTLKLVKKGG